MSGRVGKEVRCVRFAVSPKLKIINFRIETEEARRLIPQSFSFPIRDNLPAMTQYIIKLLISAAIIVAVSEISKRSSSIGGLLASLPLTSFLAMLWLYRDTHEAAKVAALSTSIFWLVLPSLVFFIALPALLKTHLSFYASFAASTAIMLACYGLMLLILKRLGIA